MVAVKYKNSVIKRENHSPNFTVSQINHIISTYEVSFIADQSGDTINDRLKHSTGKSTKNIPS